MNCVEPWLQVLTVLLTLCDDDLDGTSSGLGSPQIYTHENVHGPHQGDHVGLVTS